MKTSAVLVVLYLGLALAALLMITPSQVDRAVSIMTALAAFAVVYAVRGLSQEVRGQGKTKAVLYAGLLTGALLVGIGLIYLLLHFIG